MLCYFQVYGKMNLLYVYTYPLVLGSFPIQAITEHWQSSLCYVQFVLVIYFIYSSMCTSVTIYILKKKNIILDCSNI